MKQNQRQVLKVNVELLIALVTFQRFQILLTPEMFPDWDFVVRKAILHLDEVLLIFRYKYLYNR